MLHKTGRLCFENVRGQDMDKHCELIVFDAGAVKARI